MNPWISIVAITMALVLALRAVRSRRLPVRTKVVMALAWLVIIVIVAFAFDGFQR